MFSGKNRIIVTIKSAIISLIFIPCDIRTIKWFLAVKEKTSLIFLLTAKMNRKKYKQTGFLI